MCGKKKRVIKFEQNLCNAKVDDNSVLFVRVNDIVTDKHAIIEVPYTHTAIVIKGGGDCTHYASGNYDVFDTRAQVKDWKRGLSVEVIYIPKETQVLIGWGTPNRVRYRDEGSGKVITVGANGEFDVSVSDPELFFRKVVGAKKEFDLREFSRRFSETVATEFTDMFLRVVADLRLTYDKFDANKKEIGLRIGNILSPMFEQQWGLKVLNFKIASLDLTNADMNAVESVAEGKVSGQKIKEYLAELERLDDKQWEREKYLHELELQDNAAYYEVLKAIGYAAADRTPQNNDTVQSAAVCGVCGAVSEPSAAFCRVCGNRLR